MFRAETDAEIKQDMIEIARSMLRREEKPKSQWSADREDMYRQRMARLDVEQNVAALRPQHASTPRGVDSTGPPRSAFTSRGVLAAADQSAYQADGSGYLADGVVYVSSGALTTSTEALNGSTDEMLPLDESAPLDEAPLVKLTPLETRKSELVSTAHWVDHVCLS
jgi:hypothetical protein